MPTTTLTMKIRWTENGTQFNSQPHPFLRTHRSIIGRMSTMSLKMRCYVAETRCAGIRSDRKRNYAECRSSTGAIPRHRTSLTFCISSMVGMELFSP